MTNSQSKDTSEKSEAKGRYVYGDCFYNACYNQKNIFQGKQLKLVIGSLGLNGHFEFGGKNWKMGEFKKNPRDAHAWLEDDEGNIYDYVFSHYGYCAKHWGKKVCFPLDWEIVGISKQALKEEYGLEYISATPETQKMILEHVKPSYEFKFQQGLMTRIKMEL
jgi:hypothetical protein